MEVSWRVFDDLASRADAALEAGGSLELEARIDPKAERVARAAFERAVAYMHAYRSIELKVF